MWILIVTILNKLLRNNFRQARKCQTAREMTSAKRGNAKPFKKWFAGGPQTLYRRRMKVCMMKRSWLIIMKPVRPTLTNTYSFRLIVFLSCAETWKSFIWCFCRVQQHEKVSFGVSVVCRSAKKSHLAFLSCAEAWKSFIWCFCRVQKHQKVSFGVSVACRSVKKFHLAFLSCAEAWESKMSS